MAFNIAPIKFFYDNQIRQITWIDSQVHIQWTHS